MLILILNDVQYLQNVAFSFEKGSNGQNHSSSDSHHLMKKFPLAKFPIHPAVCTLQYLIARKYKSLL